MKKFSIVCICQIYNELRKDNLERFVKHIEPLVDALVVYDDGSADGSYEYMLKRTPYVIRGHKNDFADEQGHKRALLDAALKLKPDFILWLDADEVLTANASYRLQELCGYCVKKDLDGLSLHEINLWRSRSWQRLDTEYNNGWFVRLWRVMPGISFGEPHRGLHRSQHPSTISTVERIEDVQVIHYGFSSERRLAYKYSVYKAHGQRGYALDRLICEEGLTLKKVPRELFPEGLESEDKCPEPLSLVESLAYVDRFKEEVSRPNFSIICLIYKSVGWLKFVHEQVLKYTDLTDKEFFFVANDANDAVLAYLRDNYISHYAWENTPQQREEWFINNVYRAWNHGAAMARGDFLVFINSDMAFTPGWLDNLWKSYDGSNCVSSRLVESGKLKSGQYGVEKDFGRSYNSYEEGAFQQFAAKMTTSRRQDGGLFMPLLIRKEHFESVGGYPEGNIVPGSDTFNPVIAGEGKACISGDVVLMEKLKEMDVSHHTAFDSIVYHFQCGEMDDIGTAGKTPSVKVAICNDIVTGSMGEKVLWDFLIESLPASVGIDMCKAGKKGDFAFNARKYIGRNYPDVEVIIQNATYIGTVDRSRYTIAFLQDDLRSMGRMSKQQEENLRLADCLVTNSIQTALVYNSCCTDQEIKYNFNIIPVGVDQDLFRPMDKAAMRMELGFGKERTGIFVGNFSEVKGWSKVRECIERFSDITWILVSKKEENFRASNVRTYNRISQEFLAKLLNCADFFIVGSPVETQCLAAIEACLCDVPVVMRNVGIFKDFTDEERARAGIFGEDFISAINKLQESSFSPRQLVIEKKLTVKDSMERWLHLIEQSFNEIRLNKVRAASAVHSARRRRTKPRILLVGMSESIHTARWLAQITDQGWDVHLFPSIDYGMVHPDITDVTVHHSFYGRQDNLHGDVKYRGLPMLHKDVALLARILVRRLVPGYRAVQLKNLIERIRPDIVHSVEFQSAGYLTLEAKKQVSGGFPTWMVTNWGSDIYLYGRLPAHDRQIRDILAQCDYYACECERDIRLAREHGFKGATLPAIPNTGGFDLELAASLRQPGPVSARRDIMLKGHQHWAGRALTGLRALERCTDLLKKDGYRIVIYSAPHDVILAAELLQRKTGIPVVLVPHKTPHRQMLQMHGQARVSIGLSISDAVSTSFLEAIVMGSFPVQSWTSCANEWICDGKTGILVPPEDPDVVEQAVRLALTDDPLVDRAAEQNYILAEGRLDYSDIKTKAVEFYSSILSKIITGDNRHEF